MRQNYQALDSARHNTRTGWKGVDEIRVGGRLMYRARIGVCGERRLLGYFNIAGDAAEYYDCALVFFKRHLPTQPHADDFNLASLRSTLGDFPEECIEKCRTIEAQIIADRQGIPLPVYRDDWNFDLDLASRNLKRAPIDLWHGVRRAKQGGFEAHTKLYGYEWLIGVVTTDVHAARLHDVAGMFFSKHMEWVESTYYPYNIQPGDVKPTVEELSACARLAEQIRQTINHGEPLPEYNEAGELVAGRVPDCATKRPSLNRLIMQAQHLQARIQQLEQYIWKSGNEVPPAAPELASVLPLPPLTPEQLKFYQAPEVRYRIPEGGATRPPKPKSQRKPRGPYQRRGMKSPEEYYAEGRRAFEGFMDEQHCLHKEGSTAREHWLRGFRDAKQADHELAAARKG